MYFILLVKFLIIFDYVCEGGGSESVSYLFSNWIVFQNFKEVFTFSEIKYAAFAFIIVTMHLLQSSIKHFQSELGSVYLVLAHTTLH